MSANICIELYKSIKQRSVALMIILLMQHSFQLQTKSPTPLFPLALLTPCEKALSREEKSAQIQNTSRYRSLPSRRRADVCFLSARAPPPPGDGRTDAHVSPAALGILCRLRPQNLRSATARTLFPTGSCCEPIDGGNRLLGAAPRARVGIHVTVLTWRAKETH